MADTDSQRPAPPLAASQTGLGSRGEVFDSDLFENAEDRYAGFDTSIGVAADDEQDLRERTMAR